MSVTDAKKSYRDALHLPCSQCSAAPGDACTFENYTNKPGIYISPMHNARYDALKEKEKPQSK